MPHGERQGDAVDSAEADGSRHHHLQQHDAKYAHARRRRVSFRRAVRLMPFGSGGDAPFAGGTVHGVVTVAAPAGASSALIVRAATGAVDAVEVYDSAGNALFEVQPGGHARVGLPPGQVFVVGPLAGGDLFDVDATGLVATAGGLITYAITA